jgi:CheY-like chemotaxis protein
LEEQGFVVEVVSNAFDALRRLASGRTIDILFTDINLAGGVDGATLARRARQLLPDLPVIYTSGRCTMDRLERVEGAMFVPKPYDAFSIGRLLNQLIAAKHARVQTFA